jgi:hypothetical protein
VDVFDSQTPQEFSRELAYIIPSNRTSSSDFFSTASFETVIFSPTSINVTDNLLHSQLMNCEQRGGEDGETEVEVRILLILNSMI